MKHAFLLSLLICAACATATPRAEADATDAREASAQSERLAAELDALGAGVGPPCERACPLARNVCDLSDRICAIGLRHPGDDELTGLCRDARARCERAQDKTRACACQPR